MQTKRTNQKVFVQFAIGKSSVVVKAKSLHLAEKTGKVQDELPD
jgi:hypothetical protein